MAVLQKAAIKEEKKPTKKGKPGKENPSFWKLRLYVAGHTVKSIKAFDNLKQICDEHLKGKYHIEVIDLVKNQKFAKGDQILAVPTLVRKLPLPIRKFIGDMSATEKILLGLDLRPEKQIRGRVSKKSDKAESNEKNKKAQGEPVLEIEDLKIRLEEAQETLRAIRRGEVDGLLVLGPGSEQVYTLERHQRELQTLADNAPDLIYRVDRRMRHVFVNQRVLDITGMRREDYLGLTNRELGHPPELCDLWEETCQRAFDTKEPQEIEFIFASPEGPRNLHMRVMPEFTEDGSVQTVMGVTRDVTEHKQAEKRRQREYSETELANRVLHVFIEYEGDELFAKALSIVQEVMASRHGVFGYIAEPGHLICPSLSKMLDICEIDGKCIHYPPEKWKGLWAKALKEKHSLYSNKTSPVPTGHPIIYNNLATPILFQDEAIGLLNLANKEGGYTEQDKETLETIAARVAPVLYAWIQRKFREDERKQAEETLRESENRLRMALEAAYLISFEWDIQKNEVHRSMSREPALEKTTGDKPDTFEDVLDSVHPDDRELFRNNIKTSLNREDGKYENEFRLVRPGGEIAWLYERGRMERDEDGRPVRLIGLSQDISARKQMENRLRELNETLEQRVADRTSELSASNQSLAEYTAKLEKLNEELQEFAFVASHDLQEPLRKIQTFSDMAMKKCAAQLDGTGLDYLDRINKSTGRMRQLLHDLLQYSRVTTTKEPTKIIGLGEIIHEAAGLFEEQIRDLGGAIQIKTNSMPNIEADETQFLRVFQNAIGNALKYRGNEPPQVRIYARPAGKKACDIFIEDNGIGFEQQYAERIFRPFQRLHDRQKYEGTGMGLAICRKIIERQGGTIRAESEPGKGSTFIIRLPVKQKGKIQPDDKPGLYDNPDGRRR
jgi:PAS domain S-box-containing protein